MIKCPKCQFEQPEDIYCAQCGVNMKTFVVPKRSAVLALFSNQDFYVVLLFTAIVAFVIYDYSLSRRPKHTSVGQVTKQTSKTLDIPESQAPTNYKPAVAAASEQPTVAAKKMFGSEQRPAAVKKTDLPREEKETAPGLPTLKTSLQISFFQISRNLLNEIQREATSGQFSGDGFGGILNKKRLAILKRSNEIKAISTNRYKMDGHPISLFKGQKSGENAKSIGLYFQVNTLKNEPTATQIEVKSWGSLKLQETDENLFSSEMTLNPQYAAFVAGFLPKDKVFSDEERAIFESDRALKIYNQDDFSDGSTDLIMFVELPD
ncbi:hypothetical protein K2X05_05660 [bacterium]|nr:hypothetical protein [bacterium]